MYFVWCDQMKIPYEYIDQFHFNRLTFLYFCIAGLSTTPRNRRLIKPFHFTMIMNLTGQSCVLCQGIINLCLAEALQITLCQVVAGIFLLFLHNKAFLIFKYNPWRIPNVWRYIKILRQKSGKFLYMCKHFSKWFQQQNPMLSWFR